ncbi:MAG: hypothetical protein J6M60_02240 [Clostridia bacterium]|nr:hypothetical protein [Clostridia bacterium]
MEYQILNNKIKINLNKNIGKVIYVVEGEDVELNLLSHIFKNVLKYKEVIKISRRDQKVLVPESLLNYNSKIVIMNSKSSHVGTIEKTKYINAKIQEIQKEDEYFNVEDCPIYYIYDCDRPEDKEIIQEFIGKYTNSREASEKSDYSAFGGMLLLSYPSIESFIISNFETNISELSSKENFETTKDVKRYIKNNNYDYNKITENSLINAFNEMVTSLEKIHIHRVNLDNIEEFNQNIFNYEVLNKYKYLLSLLLISFIDLGIIEIE